MKYFSMFSGIGGFEVGIEKACHVDRSSFGGSQEDSERTDGQGLLSPEGEGVSPKEGRVGERTTVQSHKRPLCIGYSEIDRYACSIYRRHFPEHRNFGDATKLNPGEFPDFDLLVGGFPCQAFSIAGKRAGFMDARGTLFFEIARVLEYKRPRYFLLENVEGLLSHDDRKTIVAIIRVLADLGYRVSWQVLNTKDYGLPQNRERIFIAGCFGGERGPKVFPIAETDGLHPEQSGEGAVANCLDSCYGKGWKDKGQRTMLMEIGHLGGNSEQGGRIYDASGIGRTLTSASDRGEGKFTGLYFESSKIRRLTPTECCRLQGFPDYWCDWGIDDKGNKITISDTQKYRCLGNAVSTNVIARIISGWRELIS